MSDPVRCENIDAEICQRFSPGKDGGACLRCGHGETCHSVGESPTGRLVCCWRGDDKGIETCVREFRKELNFPREPVAFEMVWPRSKNGNFQFAPGVEIAPHALEDAIKDWFSVPPKTEKPREFPYPVGRPASVDAFQPMSHDLYRRIKSFEESDDLKGFTLSKIHVRNLEKLRGECPIQSMPATSNSRAAVAFFDLVSGQGRVVPIIENQFLMDRIGTHVVLCILEYRKTGDFGKAIESELERVRFRILTD